MEGRKTSTHTHTHITWHKVCALQHTVSFIIISSIEFQLRKPKKRNTPKSTKVNASSMDRNIAARNHRFAGLHRFNFVYTCGVVFWATSDAIYFFMLLYLGQLFVEYMAHVSKCLLLGFRFQALSSQSFHPKGVETLFKLACDWYLVLVFVWNLLFLNFVMR